MNDPQPNPDVPAARAETSTDAMLSRILGKLEQLERRADRWESLIDHAPGFAAMAVDQLDDTCRRLEGSGVHLDQRLNNVLTLLDRLSDDRTMKALESLLDRTDQLDAALKALDGAPGMIAMIVDMLDDYAGKLIAQGIDVEKSLRQGLHAAIWLGERVSETELERLGIFLRSDVLDPHALAVVGKSGKALATSHEGACDAQVPERLGPIGLLRALSDPDVQRSLAFGIQVARCFGRSIHDPVEMEKNPAS